MMICEHKLRKCVSFSLYIATLRNRISRISLAVLLYSNLFRNFAVINEQIKYDRYGRKRTENERYTLGLSLVFQ